MRIIFLGVGEAFDEFQPNNSSLVITQNTKLMLDCGFTAAVQLWKYSQDPNLLDGLYISHQHGDHFFGIPALFLRMWEGGRERPFTIICQKEFKDSFDSFMEFAYKGFREKFKYSIELVEAKEGETVQFGDMSLSFEATVHSGKNLAVRVESGGRSMAYSGDGSPKEKSSFYKGLDLLVLETYKYDEQIIGHSSIVSGVNFAEVAGAKKLALTHINRDVRRNDLLTIKEKLPDWVIVPEAMDEVEL